MAKPGQTSEHAPHPTQYSSKYLGFPLNPSKPSWGSKGNFEVYGFEKSDFIASFSSLSFGYFISVPITNSIFCHDLPYIDQ